ncbi:AarF/UbiB family protein [Streptomyces sp. HD1123-B1]|uniref:ABC1 kinase family protein n=1 Tax=Streptomyces huangiella TaxID=3228804 RepID=UPI003D7E8AC9
MSSPRRGTAVKAAQFALVVLVMSGFMTVFVVSARRMLGLHIGVIRALSGGLVSLAGLGVFNLVMQRPEQQGILTGVQFGSTLLLTMGFLAAWEVVLPSGSIGSPAGWPRALKSRVARGRRYSHIVSIAVRHGLRPYLRGRSGEGAAGGAARLARPLRLALEEGGPTFVKLGQMLSTRHDMLPREFVSELSRLQYQVSPAPWPAVEEALVAAYGVPLETHFKEFEPTPLAAASIAQVHAVWLHDGGKAVVKVLRPGVRPVVERDLDIIRRLAAMLERRTRWARAIGLVELAEGFAASVHEELDFRVEAANIATVRAARARRSQDDAVRLPTVHASLSGESVLVLDWLVGEPIGAATRLAAADEDDRARWAHTLLSTLLDQVLVDGVFHADPHPGNILLLDDGRVALIDFGSVGRVDAQLRAGLKLFLLAVNSGDPAALCDALLQIVERPDEIDERALERALGRFLARHFIPGSTPQVQVFADLFRLVAGYGLAVPPEAAAVFRALATLEGTLTTVCPGFNMVDEARQVTGGRRGGPAAGKSAVPSSSVPSPEPAVPAELLAAWELLRRLPRRLDRVTSALEQGRLGVGVRLFADARDRKYVRSLVHEVLLTFIAATSGVMSAILLSIERGPEVIPGTGLFQLFGYHLLVITAVLVLRVLFIISREDR